MDAKEGKPPEWKGKARRLYPCMGSMLRCRKEPASSLSFLGAIRNLGHPDLKCCLPHRTPEQGVERKMLTAALPTAWLSAKPGRKASCRDAAELGALYPLP